MNSIVLMVTSKPTQMPNSASKRVEQEGGQIRKTEGKKEWWKGGRWGKKSILKGVPVQWSRILACRREWNVAKLRALKSLKTSQSHIIYISGFCVFSMNRT